MSDMFSQPKCKICGATLRSTYDCPLGCEPCNIMKLEDMSYSQLVLDLQMFQRKIDGPENNGRVTSGGSADLDYWMDMVEDIKKEIKKREDTGPCEMESCDGCEHFEVDCDGANRIS